MVSLPSIKQVMKPDAKQKLGTPSAVQTHLPHKPQTKKYSDGCWLSSASKFLLPVQPHGTRRRTNTDSALMTTHVLNKLQCFFGMCNSIWSGADHHMFVSCIMHELERLLCVWPLGLPRTCFDRIPWSSRSFIALMMLMGAGGSCGGGPV